MVRTLTTWTPKACRMIAFFRGVGLLFYVLLWLYGCFFTLGSTAAPKDLKYYGLRAQIPSNMNPWMRRESPEP